MYLTKHQKCVHLLCELLSSFMTDFHDRQRSTKQNNFGLGPSRIFQNLILITDVLCPHLPHTYAVKKQTNKKKTPKKQKKKLFLE